MKAIIVDDEKHVREGLQLLAEWEKYGIDTILEAGDGEEAMKLITEHQPAIIFTDMRMPRCDGIDLLKWIDSSNLNSKTIVISGYDDFKYTKNCITYGGFDYILKPINPKELNDSLARAVKEWSKENNNRLSTLENEKVVWDHLLSGSLEKAKLSRRAVNQIEEEFQVDLSFTSYSVALIPMKMLIQKKYQGDAEHAFSSVLTVCNELLRTSENKGIAFRNLTKEEELVLLFLRDRTDVSNVKAKVISQIIQEINMDCKFAIGNPSHQLVEAYESASSFLNQINLLDDADPSVKKEVHRVVHLFDYSEEIKWAIQSGSIDQIHGILERIFMMFSERSYFSMEQLDVWETQFNILKEHWLKEYEIGSLDSLYKGVHYWHDNGRFSFTHFQKEKKREFHELIQAVYQVHFKKEKNSLQMIEEYIRKNYQKDIKLQDIADRFFLSREYISRKFKQEFQETITDYVTNIRIKKAKDLLENPYLKIYEVAEAVGYQNDKYFIKVFKKIEGITPSEFRHSLASKGGE
ncbi:response regulator transcription factor [Halalkalibacter lacteus]|uniref:response regulator transcription factor n=1 Tax=Halalkalibacter lacteus TaxID=3090663 RepID=UPI002FC8F13D